LKESIVKLAAELVRIPSRAGIDRVGPVLVYLTNWLAERHLGFYPLCGPTGADVGFYLHLKADRPGPMLCLNACLDTAPFGDQDRWRHPPASGVIEDGRLYGRGAADSKIAVSIFSHLAIAFDNGERLPGGELAIVFDADEHTGAFQGIKSFLQIAPRRPDAFLIGYPGNDKLIVGSRGFLRAEITVSGLAAHSGSSSATGLNAIVKMAQLIESIQNQPLPPESEPDFSIGPKVTVTEVKGGEGFSLVPDLCLCKIDFRLTPNVDKHVAREWIQSVVNQLDLEHPGWKPTLIKWKESWPPYRVPNKHPLVEHFLGAAQEVFGGKIMPVVSGPSNIGNYLASQGIPALSGFGVSYSNLHGTDESIDLETVMPVCEVYRRAIERILGSDVSLLAGGQARNVTSTPS
jgi:succinyl-diaminopimelate desuccinylase